MRDDIPTQMGKRVTPGTTFAEILKGQQKTKDSEQETTSQNTHRQQKATYNDQQEKSDMQELFGNKMVEMIERMMSKMDKILDLLVAFVTKPLNVQSP